MSHGWLAGSKLRPPRNEETAKRVDRAVDPVQFAFPGEIEPKESRAGLAIETHCSAREEGKKIRGEASKLLGGGGGNG